MRYIFIILIPVLFALAPGLSFAQATGGSGGKTITTPSLPIDVVVKVLKEVEPFFFTHCGLNFNDLYLMYQGGSCSVEFIGKTALGYEFRVETGGGLGIVILESF